MNIEDLSSIPQLPESEEFKQLSARYDGERQIIWMVMNAKPRPSFNRGLLEEIISLARLVRETAIPVKFWVTASSTAGVFNSGGDLEYFARSIRSGDRAALRSYARACIDCIDEAIHGFGVDAITIALVDGDALGGGFECALAHNFVMAQEGARLGFPEIKFNLFPGMGAYPLVTQRADMRTAERLIGWGEQHPVSWHLEKGLVDRILDQGSAYAQLLKFVDELAPRSNGVRAMIRARQRTLPVRREALMLTTEDWAESAFHVGDSAVSYMERLVARQNAFVARAASINAT